MPNEAGIWIMHGLDRNDPDCITTVEKAEEFIDSVGFLPLFANAVPGFSLEEHTVPEDWWCGDIARDPWEWRILITRGRKIAYGKFFEKKAGFVSAKWLPYFANLRRDGYDFDALWEDEKTSRKQKRIMDLFLEENAEAEIYSNELKERAGFGKSGEKGFEDTLTRLQMQTYLCPLDFRQRKNKKGQPFGWPIAVYASAEHIFGKEPVTSAYGESTEVSAKRILEHLEKYFSDASEELLCRVLGIRGK